MYSCKIFRYSYLCERLLNNQPVSDRGVVHVVNT